MSKLTKALNFVNELIENDHLSNARATIANPSAFLQNNLLEEYDDAIIVTQQYTYNLAPRALAMYMVVTYTPETKLFRVYHNSGFSASYSKKFLGAMLVAQWEGKRTELIYTHAWLKD